MGRGGWGAGEVEEWQRWEEVRQILTGEDTDLLGQPLQDGGNAYGKDGARGMQWCRGKEGLMREGYVEIRPNLLRDTNRWWQQLYREAAAECPQLEWRGWGIRWGADAEEIGIGRKRAAVARSSADAHQWGQQPFHALAAGCHQLVLRKGVQEGMLRGKVWREEGGQQLERGGADTNRWG